MLEIAVADFWVSDLIKRRFEIGIQLFINNPSARWKKDGKRGKEFNCICNFHVIFSASVLWSIVMSRVHSFNLQQEFIRSMYAKTYFAF